ncbi:type II secretion system secretin GspD [Halopseudomonas aestusnigri]|jgi:general secretion pathway protein D|uniref:type II secretion system secretin GspD n=1 Tax=Halopseudomonas TaxID=2901189 RepID=UPI001D191736|nr:type II secretion system secretin GspD [Halopseudomonas aestusnigri]MCC4260743.1 type II secretion system secretin GspD [Halopseudomonas aestusnigri]UGV31721.1 type II secretion system secretin GspD [Halopseudomonas aestusnigri]|tara:strand:+ start:5404 stop:7449 length:2046 start_codon:yes stop_codon:yes gene_type:complete
MPMQFRKQRLALALALTLGVVGSPVLAQSATETAERDQDLVLNLRDADINGLIEIVSQETGINFIVDPRVRGQVNVVSGQPIRREELYDLFLGVLKSQGFAAVRGSDGMVRIVPEVQAKENEVAGLTGDTPGDEYITEVITVNNMDAGQLVRILRPLVPKGGHLAAAAASNSLVIADTAANVRRIQALIARMDRESTEDFEVLPLEYASALDVVRIVQGLDSNAPAEEFTRGPKLIADERTNSVILRGDPEARATLRSVVRRLDVEGDQGNTQVHYLRYAKAEEVAEVLRGIAEGRERNQSGTTSTSSGNTTASNTAEQNRVRIEAHESTNAVVIYGPAELSRELSSIIRQLDIRRAQVLVEAVIAEVSYDRAKELGVQWGFGSEDSGVGIINFNRNGNSIVDLAAGVNAFLEGDVSSPPSLGSGLSLGGIGSIGSTQIALLVNALQGDTASNILSTPSLLTLDNEEAEIVVGQNVPFIVGRSVEDSGQAFDTIQREDVGIKLKIRPQINEGNAVRLEIAQEVSQIAPGTSGAADIITNKRSLTTHVMVDDNQMIVLGGLIDDQMVETADKVPGLGDIPGLGRLFRYDTASLQKRNLMVFLRPVIVRDSAVAESLTHAKYSYIRDRQVAEQNRHGRMDVGEGVPVLPDWNYLLTLPPPFENAMQGTPAPAAISAPPSAGRE